MIWQDIVLTVVSWVFAAALIPQIVHGFRDKVGPIRHQTSVPTFVGLFIISFTYWTLDLPYSMITTFLVGLMWFILFVQRLLYHK